MAHAAFDILRRQFAQIAVEWLDAAGKALAIMGRGQGFDPKASRHFGFLMSDR
jgi:hypothetical protein